jgi:hypothetical protein
VRVLRVARFAAAAAAAARASLAAATLLPTCVRTYAAHTCNTRRRSSSSSSSAGSEQQHPRQPPPTTTHNTQHTTTTTPQQNKKALVSWRLDLGLSAQLLVAAARCVAQLAVLGTILAPIFDAHDARLVAAYAAFMMVVAAGEAIQRPSHTYRGLFATTLGIVAATSAAAML